MSVEWGPGGIVGEHEPTAECWGCVAIFAEVVLAWSTGDLRSDLSDVDEDLPGAFAAFNREITRTSHAGWGEGVQRPGQVVW